MFGKDILTCSDCGFSRQNASSFINVSIDIPDYLESEVDGDGLDNPKSHSLAELVAAQLNPEYLDEDNRWECDRCKVKVQASKCLKYETLPKTLLLHLKRFRFDPVWLNASSH